MYYGDVVTILSDKIRISEKEIAPIGILNDSKCWGRWIPDRWLTGQDIVVPKHLVISPFDIDSWPVLFRLTIAIEQGVVGSLGAALSVIRDFKLNILAIEGTQSGHHHAILNIIGEAIDLKHDKDLLEFGKCLPESSRNFKNKEVDEYIHEKFAPRMLGFSNELVRALMDSDAKRHFLRGSINFGNSDRRRRGVFFNPDRINGIARDEAFAQCPGTIKCTWLQNHAYFWLFGDGLPNSYGFKYKSQKWSLKPDDNWQSKYFDEIKNLKPPFKSIASINFEEQYLRVVLSDSDVAGRTVHVRTPFDANFKDQASTIGLLSKLCEGFGDHHVNLRSVSMFTEFRDSGGEKGAYAFLSDLPYHKMMNSGDKLSMIEMAASEGTEKAKNTLAHSGCAISFMPVETTPFVARRLFVSTKFDWLQQEKLTFYSRLKTAAANYGFRIVMAHPDYLDDEYLSAFWDGNDSLTANVVTLLRASDAFLQILPVGTVAASSADNPLNWVLFESGAAHSLRMPAAICVDVDKKHSMSWWIDKLKVGTGKMLFEFSSLSDDDNMMKKIEKAIEVLSVSRRQWRASRR